MVQTGSLDAVRLQCLCYKGLEKNLTPESACWTQVEAFFLPQMRDRGVLNALWPRCR